MPSAIESVADPHLRSISFAERATSADEAPFFPVPPGKFVLMSICTFGLFELYWAYKNWQHIRDASLEDLSPFWRAGFAPLWNFSLFRRVREDARRRGLSADWEPWLLGISYFVLGALWRLPDPGWLLSMATFIPLLPVVMTIQRINAVAGVPPGTGAGYSTRAVIFAVGGGLLLLLALLGTFFPE